MKRIVIVALDFILGFTLIFWGTLSILVISSPNYNPQRGFMFFCLGVLLWINSWVLYNDT